MTFASSSAAAGRRPIWVAEMDLDYCAHNYASRDDTVAGFNENHCHHSEELTDADWVLSGANIAVAHSALVDPPPAGSAEVYEIDETDGANIRWIYQVFAAASLGAGVKTIFARVQAGTAQYLSLQLREGAGVFQARGEFVWTAGVLTVFYQAVGVSSVVSLGGGWYEAIVRSEAIVEPNEHRVELMPGRTIGGAADTGTVYCAGVMVHDGATKFGYQFEEDHDASATNIRLTTGGLTADAEIGDRAYLATTTEYLITHNGTDYVRVTGDATGHGLGAWVSIAPTGTFCTAALAAGSECYKTYATCQDSAHFSRTTKTYRFCEACLSAQEQVEIAAIPSLRAVEETTPRITRGQGIGSRGTVSLRFQDHPHHDRGVDPYVATRSYTPMTQGTFWSKLRARNPYYQGRVLRVKMGYVESPMDLAADFETRTYFLEKIEGPSADHTVTVTAKDLLKFADDDRALAPVPSEGVLDANIAADAGSLTLSPAGIGNTDYPASGTLRVDAECMTFTRVADVCTLTGHGTNGTTAATHTAGATVQLCLVYTAYTVDDVVYDLLVTYAGVPAGYCDTANWATEVSDWLSGHVVTGIVTEPTGVNALLSELTSQYLFDLWWDPVAALIKLHVLQPHITAPDILTESGNIIAGSMEVTDQPEDRKNCIIVYYGIRDATTELEEKTNYSYGVVYSDIEAQGASEYDDYRTQVFYSRWFTTEGDAMRLGQRTLLATRDVPRSFRFKLDAKDSYDVGDVVTLRCHEIVSETGADADTDAYIISRGAPQGAHAYEFEAVKESFSGRYGIITPDAAPDYGSATAAQKLIYGYVCPDSGTFADGTAGYKAV